MHEDPRRRIPRTDDLLAEPDAVAAAGQWGRERVREELRRSQQLAREGALAPQEVLAHALSGMPSAPPSLRRVLNATGVVVHTNLGRAPLSAAALEALVAAAGYVDLELDLATGRRGGRGLAPLAALRAAAPDAAAAMVVNNGAAALLLAVTALAAGREAVVSRGELVEIGAGFRLPDLMESAGARLREVGTTNRTTLADYAGAVGPQTGCIVRIHPSNFRLEGFTSSVPVGELATLGVPVVVDTGSGLLAPDPGLSDEPDVASALRAGAAVVTTSGDKLLGGPQAGLVLGREDEVERMRRHPMARALRVDKLALAALEATLCDGSVPVTAYRRADPDELRRRAGLLADRVGGTVTAHDGLVGGGGAPGTVLPGWAVAVPEQLADRLRAGDPAVVGRTEGGRLLLDLRCIPPDADDHLARAVETAARDAVG